MDDGVAAVFVDDEGEAVGEDVFGVGDDDLAGAGGSGGDSFDEARSGLCGVEAEVGGAEHFARAMRTPRSTE